MGAVPKLVYAKGREFGWKGRKPHDLKCGRSTSMGELFVLNMPIEQIQVENRTTSLVENLFAP